MRGSGVAGRLDEQPRLGMSCLFVSAPWVPQSHRMLSHRWLRLRDRRRRLQCPCGSHKETTIKPPKVDVQNEEGDRKGLTPAPNMPEPMIGMIQWTHGREDHPNQNKPIVTRKLPSMADGRRYSGSALPSTPVRLAFFSISWARILTHSGPMSAAQNIPTSIPRNVSPVCQRLNP